MKIRLFWVVFFMSNVLNGAQSSFTMGSKVVTGYSAVYKGFHIYQPYVAGQTGNSCGYHAVFNAQGFLQCVQGLDFDFMSTQARAVLFGTDQAPWKAFVLERDPLYASGDLVEADVLDQMAQRFFTGIGNNFAVLDNDQNFLGRRNARFNSTNPKQKQQNLDTFFREVQQYIAAQTPCSYAFFINTANAFAGEFQSNAHWFMVLLYKDTKGVHTYYIADSLNQNLTDSPFVTALIDRIERPLPPVASSSSTTTQTGVPLKKEQNSPYKRDSLASTPSEQEQIAQALRESAQLFEEQQLRKLQEEAKRIEEAQRARAERELQEALRLSAPFVNQGFPVQSYEEQQLKRALELSMPDPAVEKQLTQEQKKLLEISSQEAELRRWAQKQADDDLERALQLSLEGKPEKTVTQPRQMEQEEPLMQEQIFALVAAQRNFGALASSSSSTPPAETEEQKRGRVAREAAEKRAQTVKKREEKK